MAIASIHHVNITAPQEVIDKVLHFYVDILGLTEGYRPDFGIPGNWLYQGDHPMVHLLVSDNPAGENGFFDHVAFRCTDLAGITEKLKTNDIPFGVFEMDELKQTQMFLTDPAGIKVELNFYDEKPA